MGGGDTFTLDKSAIASAQWSRAAKGYEIKIFRRDTSLVHQFDGFQQEDYDRISRLFKNWYSVILENKEHALRGWNWGKADFTKNELTFSVQNKPAFELPYSEIGNTNLAGRNEVAVEMALPQDSSDTGTNGHLGGARGKGKKAGAGRDQLVEMRFYVPGVATVKDGGEDGDSDGGAGEEEKNAATLFYETLIEKAEIGEMAGDTIATFLEVLHLTPRYVFTLILALKVSFANSRCPEVVSISICTRPPSVCAERHTTTRSNTRLSRSLWSFPSPTTCTACSVLVSTLRCVKVRRGILSLSCNLRRTRR